MIPVPDGSVDKVLGAGSDAGAPPSAAVVKRAVVLGLARSGQAAAALLERAASRSSAPTGRSGTTTTSRCSTAPTCWSRAPACRARTPLVARRRAIPIWSEVELGYRLLPNPILGVTGTNGKTTTTEWLGAMFRAAGREVAVRATSGAR